MNDSALKSFCTWARTELIKGVEAQMVRYGITEPAPAPVGSETVSGLPLSPAEIEQRDELLRMQAEMGHEALRDRAAYTWFNRIVAIRFMDARGWLPSRMRMLSRADGSHGSEAVENALDVEIAMADTDRIAELKMAGLDDRCGATCLLLSARSLPIAYRASLNAWAEPWSCCCPRAS